jgi:hypothetical protein
MMHRNDLIDWLRPLCEPIDVPPGRVMEVVLTPKGYYVEYLSDGADFQILRVSGFWK